MIGEIRLNALESLPLLLKNKYIIIGMTAVTGLMMLIISAVLIKPVYMATASLIINKSDAATDSSVTYDDVLMNAKLVKTYSFILTSSTVLKEAENDLGIDIPIDSLKENVSIDGLDDTEILIVSVKNPDRALAARIANEIADIAANKLFITSSSIELQPIDDATSPSRPYSPDIKKYAALGLLAGFFVSCLIFVVLYYVDNTIKTQEDLRQYCDNSILAVIPRLGAGASNPRRPPAKKA
jgi:capsular polysaccharide biosynthesis protein